jgi:cytochrome c oxidase cbb3-type subunit 3
VSEDKKAAPTGSQEDQVIHEYDGIEEYDNNLPLWWLATFVGTVVFAVGYWFAYESYHSFDHPRDEYEKVAAAAKAAQKAAGPVSADALVAMSKDTKAVEAGKVTFTTMCAACHKPDGSGNIGPNLTDANWLHGGKPDQIYKTVSEGVPEKQMPPWGPALGGEKVQQVVAFVLTIKNTNVAGGKAPQGDPEQ